MKRLWVIAPSLLLVLGAACSSEDATPIDPGEPTIDLTDITHTVEPTQQMRDAAEAQCLDDPDLAEGYVRAVDPNTDEVFSEITVDCSDLR